MLIFNIIFLDIDVYIRLIDVCWLFRATVGRLEALMLSLADQPPELQEFLNYFINHEDVTQSLLIKVPLSYQLYNSYLVFSSPFCISRWRSCSRARRRQAQAS